MNKWKLVLAPVQLPVTRKLLICFYWPELSFLLESLLMVTDGFTPPSFGEKMSLPTCDHYSCIWSNIPIDTFPIILPTYKGFHFAGVACVIFRASYGLWLCHLGSAQASASDQQPFWEPTSAVLTGHLLPALCLNLIQNTAAGLVFSSDGLPRAPHHLLPVLQLLRGGLPPLMSACKCAWELKMQNASKGFIWHKRGLQSQENKNIKNPLIML